MTRQASPVEPPVVLTVAGSDSGGGAGVQADVKTIEASGAFATTAVTSVTAQHTRGVAHTHPVPVQAIEAQVEAVREDFDVAAVKTGMLGTREVVDLVADRAPSLPSLVVDPVMVAASGDRLLDPDAESAYEDLLAAATLVTPNADEAAVLTGVEVTDAAAAREAGERLVEMGARAALVTGGHVPGETVVDVLVTGEGCRSFRHERVDTDATHGSGCTLSSAVATRLAHGDDLGTAVSEGLSLLASAVRYGLDVGEGPGSVHHLVGVRDDAARLETVEAVERAVARLRERDAGPLVWPGRSRVAGATPYAETPRDVAAVETDLAADGDEPGRGRVGFGAAGDLGRTLLAVRESAPSVRFALACRRTDALADALADLPNPVAAASEGDASPDAPRERRVAAACEALSAPPVAYDGATRCDRLALLAPDPESLVRRAGTLSESVTG